MRSALAIGILLCSLNAFALTKIACVGDSITFGLGVRPKPSYPESLGKILGTNFQVENFGNSGKTCGDYPSQKKGGRWYGDTTQHQDAIKFQPDIFICNLGINDTGAWWDEKLFQKGYETLIQDWKASNKNSQLYMWTKLGPDFRGPEGKAAFPGNIFAPTFKYNTKDNGSSARRPTAEKILSNIAKKEKAIPIDAYTYMAQFPAFYKDGLHPSPEGAQCLAVLTFRVLAKELKLEQKAPRVTVNPTTKTVTLTNTMPHGFLLNGWGMGYRGVKPVIALESNICILPGESIEIQFGAKENQLSDPNMPLTCTLPCREGLKVVNMNKQN